MSAALAKQESEPTFLPIPTYFTISDSLIHGKGLFAAEDIPAEFTFGISHVYTTEGLLRRMFPDGWVRSSWGALYNMDPVGFNCITEHHGNPLYPREHDFKILKSCREILAGEEITVDQYTLYDPVP